MEGVLQENMSDLVPEPLNHSLGGFPKPPRPPKAAMGLLFLSQISRPFAGRIRSFCLVALKMNHTQIRRGLQYVVIKVAA